MAMTATERSLNRLRRIRERGGAVLNIRVSAGALAKLHSLCANHRCNMNDAVEGLLLGNITHVHALGLSHSEVECAKKLGIDF